MHTFKREEKSKSLVAIIFLMLNNTAISKKKRVKLIIMLNDKHYLTGG